MNKFVLNTIEKAEDVINKKIEYKMELDDCITVADIF